MYCKAAAKMSMQACYDIEMLRKNLLADSIDQVVVVGPLVHRPDVDGWYFTIATAGSEGFRHDCIYTAVKKYEVAEARRAAIVSELTKPGVDIRTSNDELEMARTCETLWPGERITNLRKAVEAERTIAARRTKHSNFYERYIRHMPQVPVDAPLERGRVYHTVFQHNDWCRFYETENLADCNCNPIMSRHVESERS
jgi:hypothetical protein